MLSAILDRLTGRSDDDRPDTSTARGRDELLRQRERALQGELAEARKRLEALEAEVPVAVAAGDADGPESRTQRVQLRAQVDDLEAGLEAVQEAREQLVPAVLQEEAEEEAERSRRALRRAKKAAKELGRAADRLLAREVAALAEVYGTAREATGRVREIRRELANVHGEDRASARARELDGQLRRDAHNGMAALRAMQMYADRRRD